MVGNGFNYTFTPEELFYMMFGKKECPECHNKMVKEKRFEYVKGKDVQTGNRKFYMDDADVKRYYYVFKCKECGAEYQLKDLVNKKG